MRLELEIDEIVRVYIAHQHDIAPAAAVPPVGPAERLVLFAAKRNAAAPPVPGLGLNDAFIDEHASDDTETNPAAKAANRLGTAQVGFKGLS
jgi:hypothetical protein